MTLLRLTLFTTILSQALIRRFIKVKQFPNFLTRSEEGGPHAVDLDRDFRAHASGGMEFE
jgi:hypothetical protein